MKLIITADWHLRKDLPSCRIDENWIEFQKNVIEFIINITNDKNAKLCIIGDIFHRAKADIEIINLFLDMINQLKDYVYIIAGNHDLLYHNINNEKKSAFGIIWKSNKVLPLWKLGTANHFGIDKKHNEESNILFLHDFIYDDILLKKFSKGYYFLDLFNEYQDKKWIFTGDNHQGFIKIKNEENNKRFLINPGCISIQTIDMINYNPFIVYVDTDKEFYEIIKIPDFGAQFVDYSNKIKQDQEIKGFVEMLKNSKNYSFDYLSNIKKELQNIKDKKLKQFILDYIKIY